MDLRYLDKATGSVLT